MSFSTLHELHVFIPVVIIPEHEPEPVLEPVPERLHFLEEQVVRILAEMERRGRQRCVIS